MKQHPASTEGLNDILGELIGTFILVFFGCGSVAVTVLYSAHTGLCQIAALWGIAVALAIYATRNISCAHLNPAVSIAMVVANRMSVKKTPYYLFGQFLGAFLAAMVIYGLFSSSITNFEAIHGIVRGTPASIKTAMMFGEYYPNPGVGAVASVNTLNAFFAECIGTFALVFMIFSLTEGCNTGRLDATFSPLFIGGSVTVIISVTAPLTQAGLNPARDLSPRLFSYLAGWGQAAFRNDHYGFLTVYVVAPICGGVLSALLFRKVIEPVMLKKNNSSSCDCN